MTTNGQRPKNIIFSVRNLECAYGSKPKVLKVDKLDIYSGEIVVLLGPSGSGKSTFLETLGLMTKTIVSGSVEFNGGKNGIYNFETIWDPNKEDERTRARKENFNFVFQSTNLMDNLTNRENVSIAELVKDNVDILQSFNDSHSTLYNLNLAKNKHDDLPKDCSGGERQRVSFARSIQRDFVVLFGDEPTGNLDAANAKEVLEFAKKEIKGNNSRAAIIVSHNVKLATEFADRIIVLEKEKPGDTFYQILDRNVFVKTHNENNEEARWSVNETEKTADDVIKAVIDIFGGSISKNGESGLPKSVDATDTSNPKQVPNETSDKEARLGLRRKLLAPGQTGFFAFICLFVGRCFRMNKSLPVVFQDLFFIKEGYELMGKKKKLSFLITFIALFLVMFFVGFSSGSLIDLRKKMQDPFVNAVQALHVGGLDNQQIIDNTIDHFLEQRGKYLLDTIYTYNRFYLQFARSSDSDHDPIQNFVGKTVLHNDPILERVLDESVNNAVGRSFSSVNDRGIIVTRELLGRLNLNDDAKFLFIERMADGENYYRVPVPIIAIVDNLPGRNRNFFLTTQVFFENFMDQGGNFLVEDGSRFIISAFVGEEESVVLEEALIDVLSRISDTYHNIDRVIIRKEYRPEVSHIPHYDYMITIRPTGQQNLALTKELFNKVIADREINDVLSSLNLKAHQDFFQSFTGGYVLNLVYDQREKDEIAFIFEEPSMIRQFAADFSMATGNRIELDLATVENMHTFTLVRRLTLSITIMLIIASIIAIARYIYDVLDQHLYKIRMNIGTLKAFGINVGGIYKVMLFMFVFIAVFISFFMAWGIGSLVSYAGWINFSFFGDLRSILILAGTLLVIKASAFIVYVLAQKRYFSKSPGDLIYDRTDHKKAEKEQREKQGEPASQSKANGLRLVDKLRALSSSCVAKNYYRTKPHHQH